MGVGIALRPAGGPEPVGSTWRTGTPADDTLVQVARAAVAGVGTPGGGVAGGWGAAFDDFWCTVRPTGARCGRRREGGAVLIGDRYALTTAVRHGSNGGVFLGTDTRTGDPVVIKQALAHIEVDRAGTEARTALRHEARLLGELAGLGLTARPLGLIEQADSLLLVREHLPGQPLGSWVAARLTPGGAPGVPWEQAGPMALALVGLLARVHAHGLVLRDLSPENVLVTPQAQGPRLHLIDLELACAAGTVAGAAGTPGYRAPEQTAAGGWPPAARGSRPAAPAADLFALGGLLFLLATGHDPLLPEAPGRPVPERLGRWLALAAREGDTARRLAPAVLGLRAEQPGGRWTLDRLRELLAGVRAAAPAGAPAGPPPEQVDRVLDRVLLDGLRQLAASATWRRSDRLWPSVPAGQHTDPCTVQHGAAGVLALLARALRQPGLLPAEPRSAVELTARRAAQWIERRCAAEPLALPGRHFGRSGAAWALLDAAEALGDPALAERARRLAAPVPPHWPGPSHRPDPAICHGAAGAGFLRLRLGEAEAALTIARGLLAVAEEEAYGTVRTVPEDVDSSLTGRTHLGHAHGVASVGAFLLAVHQATGDRASLAGAERAAHALAATARRGGTAARWQRSAGEPPGVRLAHGCSGSLGVGSFLVRLWQQTGDPALRELTVAAGLAVLDGRRHSATGACPGLAGNGDYLLDLARATGEPRFSAGARELAELIAARATLQDGLLVLPDGTGTGCAAGYGTGTAGQLAFLLRLRHGGPRLWLDPAVVPDAEPAEPNRPTSSFEEVSP
ncbi:lanthionine synthetase LanC family protein [Kitasatospora sp. NPDC008050]|uniref:lanthionine synthetase LanC family protein n=1 Tax=Kitasatospora sp. NPDC008050 TaxID=3364021 RepID=UPI0036EC5EC2